MEAKAKKRYIPTSPRKMRLVVDLIRGKSVDEALNILHYSPKHASKVVELTLLSAVSNLSNKSESGRVEEKNVIVKEVFVDGGPDVEKSFTCTTRKGFQGQKTFESFNYCSCRKR